MIRFDHLLGANAFKDRFYGPEAKSDFTPENLMATCLAYAFIDIWFI